MKKYRKRINDNLFWILFVLAYFLLLFVWSLNQPFNSCPDEEMRYQIPKFIFQNGYLPDAYEQSIISPLYGFSYAHQPQLPYIISSMLMRFISFFSSNDFVLLMGARMTSVFCGVLFVVYIIKIANVLLNNNKLRVIFIFLCSLWPQLVFVFTYVNCDSMAMLSVAIIIYYWIKTYRFGWDYLSCIGLSIGISLALLSYLNVYVFVLLTVVYFVLYFVFIDKSSCRIKCFFKYGSLIFGLVLLFAGWHFIRNIIIYNGDIFAFSTYSQITLKSEIINNPSFQPGSIREKAAKEMLSTLSGNISWMNSTIVSFVGMFGYMRIPLDIWIYFLYFSEVFFALLLNVFCFIRERNVFRTKGIILNFLLLSSIILTVFVSYIYSHSDYQPQGRYILGALIPLCIFMIYGYSCLGNIKGRWKNLWVIIPLFNSVAILRCLIIIITEYTS